LGENVESGLNSIESTFVIEIVDVKQFAGFPDCAGQVRVAADENWKRSLHVNNRQDASSIQNLTK
jgi:hypothetical protein